MSIERLKKYLSRFKVASFVLSIITLILIGVEILLFTWQTLMPGKFVKFFSAIKLYVPFTSNIDNNPQSLFELAGGILSLICLYLVMRLFADIFGKLCETLSLSEVTLKLRQLSYVVIGEALLVPLIKKLAYFVFLDTSAPKGTHSWSMILVGFFIYFIAIFIDSTTAANINDKGE